MKVTSRNWTRLELVFFWQGVGKKKKYHMVKWEGLCTPKEFGGLGFLNIRAMNKALLAKWLYRIESGDDSLCIRILKKKYLGQQSIFQKDNKGVSFFWTGLQKTKDWYKFGRDMLVGNGICTRFWSDSWRGNSSLGLRYPNLFRICQEKFQWKR